MNRLREQRQVAREVSMEFADWLLWCVTIALVCFVLPPFVHWMASH